MPTPLMDDVTTGNHVEALKSGLLSSTARPASCHVWPLPHTASRFFTAILAAGGAFAPKGHMPVLAGYRITTLLNLEFLACYTLCRPVSSISGRH